MATGTELHTLKGHKSKVTIVTLNIFLNVNLIISNERMKRVCACSRKWHSQNVRVMKFNFRFNNKFQQSLGVYLLYSNKKRRRHKKECDRIEIQWYCLREQSAHNMFNNRDTFSIYRVVWRKKKQTWTHYHIEIKWNFHRKENYFKITYKYVHHLWMLGTCPNYGDG